MSRAAARAVVIAALLVVSKAGVATPPPDDQLASIRSRIDSLEHRITDLAAASADVARERERLNAELELAEARVHENELTLERAETEARTVRDDAGRLAADLAGHRELLRRHLEMVALLGRPGPMQLLLDATGHGDLEQALATVGVLTTGQVRLYEEFNRMRAEYAARLNALSRVVQVAQDEARDLAARRNELQQVRQRVEARLVELERSRVDADLRLADLKEREQALERLIATLQGRSRFTGRDDIRRYRGALPWPVDGRIVRGFGRHYLPTYTTYTVCNGLRFDAAGGAEVRAVFPGVVAYARHFRGYGNMVVIDHGHDVYSLAAGLATILVRLDSSVALGARLGLAAPPTPDGNVYFEIRVGEEPQDPRRWFELVEGR